MSTLDEEMFLKLMSQYEDIENAVLGKASLGKDSGISYLGSYFWPFIQKPAWLTNYSREQVQQFASQTGEKMALISKAHHALGIMSYFPSQGGKGEYQGRDQYAACVSSVFSKAKQYADTLHNLYLIEKPGNCFNQGYYNVGFQESLIFSLEKFIQQKKSAKEKIPGATIKALEETLRSMKASLEYYKTYSKKDRFDQRKIISDLDAGEMRFFSIGRMEKGNFHTLNITIKGDMLIICDRFDVGIQYKSIPGAMYSSITERDTGRKEGDGTFIYKLKKPFFALGKDQKERLIHWITKEISEDESIFGIKRVLKLDDDPIVTLKGKRQTKGNCRYASKKAAIGGAIFASLVAADDSKDTKEKQEIASRLHKEFTAADRINKIDEIINSELLREEEKEELLLLALFRNNDPKNNSDKEICKKITTYLKENKGERETEELLASFIKKIGEEIEEKFKKSPSSAQKYKALQFLHQSILILKESSIVFDIKQSSEQDHTVSGQPTRKPSS